MLYTIGKYLRLEQKLSKVVAYTRVGYCFGQDLRRKFGNSEYTSLSHVEEEEEEIILSGPTGKLVPSIFSRTFTLISFEGHIDTGLRAIELT